MVASTLWRRSKSLRAHSATLGSAAVLPPRMPVAWLLARCQVYDVLSMKPGEDISGCRLMLSGTDLSSEDYGNDFIQAYKQRLGVGDSPGDTVTVLRSTVMDPWLTETAKGSFLDIVEDELRLALSKALSEDALLQVFENMDTNADGALDRREIDAKFQAMGYGAEDTQAFWQFANRNADDRLSRQEFLEHFSQFLVLMSSKPREPRDRENAGGGITNSAKRNRQRRRCRRVGSGR